MKIEGNKIIFEKLIEANPARREGEIGVNQAITIPEPAAVSSCANARGSFSTDITSLINGMKQLSSKAAALNIRPA